MDRRTVGAVLGLFLFAGCLAGCAPITIHTVQNRKVSLAGHHTFSFGRPEQAPPGFHRTALSPEVYDRIKPQLRSLLEAKGYHAVESGGDFVVHAGSGVHIHESIPDPAMDIDADVEVHYTEGTLSIDVFDAATKALAWHGSSLAAITPGHLDPQLLSASLAKIMDRFPAATP